MAHLVVIRRIFFLGLILTTLGVWYWFRQSTDVAYLEIEQAINNGDTTLARQKLEELLQKHPDHSRALVAFGDLKLQDKAWDEAIELYQKVDPGDPKSCSLARWKEGEVWLQKNQAKQAERRFLESALLDSESTIPLEQLLRLYAMQRRSDDVDRVCHAIRRVRPLRPAELAVYASRETRLTPADEAIPLLRHYVESDASDQYSCVALCQYLSETGQINEAIQKLQSRSDRERSPPLNWLLAELYLQQGQLQDAYQILLANPVPTQSPAPESARAESIIRTVDLVKLSKEAHQATSGEDRSPLGETSSLGIRTHARYAMDTRDWKRAEPLLRELIRRNAFDSGAQFMWGQCLVGSGRPEESKVQFELCNRLNLLFEQLGAVGNATQKLGLKSRHCTKTAEIMLELGEPEAAAEWYEAALFLSPDDSEIRQGLDHANSARTQRAVHGEPVTALTPLLPPRGVPSPAEAVDDPMVAGSSASLSETLPEWSQSHPLTLVDEAQSLGLHFVYFSGNSGFKYTVETLGGGVGVIDLDLDGSPDLFMTQGGPLPPGGAVHSYGDQLFRNRLNRWDNITALTGIEERDYGQGVTVGDLDNDGLDDIVVAQLGRNRVWINHGDGTFSDGTDEWGLHSEHMTSSLALADFDQDGDLDLYEANYIVGLEICHDAKGRIVTCGPVGQDAAADVLWENDGQGHFVDQTAASGITAVADPDDGKGLGIMVAHLDDDQKPDVFVTNDTRANFLFINASQPGQLQFQEQGVIRGVAFDGQGRTQASMGIACADLTSDGLNDLFVTNFYQEQNTLYVNLGEGRFEDQTQRYGLAIPSLPWLGFGTVPVDLDRDGEFELFVTNGHIDDVREQGIPWKMPPQLFRKNATGDRYVEVSRDAGAFFAEEHLGRGVARLDWNADGLWDLAIGHQDEPAALLTNRTAPVLAAVRLEFVGTQSNRGGRNLVVRTTTGGETQMQELVAGDGFQASNQRIMLLPVPAGGAIEKILVAWPSGETDELVNVSGNRTLTIVEGQQVLDTPWPSLTSER